MSDDIVTRLREYEAITDNAYVINALVAAADEIEKLRYMILVLCTWLNNEGVSAGNEALQYAESCWEQYRNVR